MQDVCYVCGNKSFTQYNCLWPELIEQWDLSATEVAYVNKQQGYVCQNCGTNWRSNAIAKALNPFIDFLSSKNKVLEINEAGTLHGFLQSMPCHIFGSYPEIDMMNIKDYPDNTFDYVIHSDTLEHVPDPIKGLSECKRVLKDGGSCIYTVPIISKRMSRRRDGMEPSYHGAPGANQSDYTVITEYGADFWTECALAGFTRIELHILDFPSAIAIECIK